MKIKEDIQKDLDIKVIQLTLLSKEIQELYDLLKTFDMPVLSDEPKSTTPKCDNCGRSFFDIKNKGVCLRCE